MEVNTQVTILRSYATEDAPDMLITEVRYDYTGDIEESITIEVYHFQPQDEEQVTLGINNRGESEKAKLIAKKRIADMLKNDNLNGG